MNGVIRITQQTTRRAARVISSSATAFWLFILLDIIACDLLVGFVCLNWEMALLLALVTASIISVILAWRTEGLGGIVMIVWGILFAFIAAVDSEAYLQFSILVTGVPFLIAGFLFLISWWLSRRTVLNH